MLITVGITTAVWLAVTFLTPPEPAETLVAFYRRVRPAATFWKPIAKLAPDVKPARDMGYNLLDWISGCVMIYGALFGIGKVILGAHARGYSVPGRSRRRRRDHLLGPQPARLENCHRIARVRDTKVENRRNAIWADGPAHDPIGVNRRSSAADHAFDFPAGEEHLSAADERRFTPIKMR